MVIGEGSEVCCLFLFYNGPSWQQYLGASKDVPVFFMPPTAFGVFRTDLHRNDDAATHQAPERSGALAYALDSGGAIAYHPCKICTVQGIGLPGQTLGIEALGSHLHDEGFVLSALRGPFFGPESFLT